MNLYGGGVGTPGSEALAPGEFSYLYRSTDRGRSWDVSVFPHE